MEARKDHSKLCYLNAPKKGDVAAWLREFKAIMSAVSGKIGEVKAVFIREDGIPEGVNLNELLEVHLYPNIPAGHFVLTVDPDLFLDRKPQPALATD